MAGSRKPGPLGLNSEAQDLNDGTLIRALSPRPGPICAHEGSSAGLHAKTSVTSVATLTSNKPAAKVQLQVLHQGRRGPEVKKLQRLLNVRLAPSPRLAIDGIFGPLTHQGVLQYQRGLVITPDGVVGKKTWYHLLKGDKVKVFPLPPPQLTPHPSSPELQGLAQPPNWTPLPTQKVGVWEWAMQDKFVEVLRRTAPKVPGSMRKEFEALLSPTSLAFMGGALVLWAGSHAFAVGEIVDVILLMGGLFFLGLAVFDVARELGDFLVVTSTATDEKDLDEAASHLARAIAIMGVAAFIALLAKVAKGRGGKAKVEDVPEPPSRRNAPSQSPRKQIETKPLPAPTELTEHQLSAWYKNQGEYFNDPKKLESHLAGTDFKKPVILRELPEGTEVIQYVRADGKPGMYFARPGTPMEQLGILEPPPRIVQRFVVKKPIEVVESTAATLETKLAPGVEGTGGGQQLIFPKGWESSVKTVPGGR